MESELCGCGKPVHYEVADGKMACNKHYRCLSRHELQTVNVNLIESRGQIARENESLTTERDRLAKENERYRIQLELIAENEDGDYDYLKFIAKRVLEGRGEGS